MFARLRSPWNISYFLSHSENLSHNSCLCSGVMTPDSEKRAAHAVHQCWKDRGQDSSKKNSSTTLQVFKNAENMLNCLYPLNKAAYKTLAFGVWKQWQDAQQTHPQSICVMKAVARSHDQINSLENWRVCVFSLSPSFLIVVNHLYVDKSTGKRA